MSKKKKGTDAKKKEKQMRRRRGTNAKKKLKLLTFKDGSATTVFEIFTIFTKLPPSEKQKRLLNDRRRYCVVKKSFFSSDCTTVVGKSCSLNK